MIRLKKLIYLLFFIFSFCFIYGASDDSIYTHVGTDDYTSSIGTGQWNTDLVDYTVIGNKGLSSGSQVPVIDDLDNNGVKEIIVLDSGTIKVYQGKSLVLVDTYIIKGSHNDISNIVIEDIDLVGNKEIIFFNTLEEELTVLNYTDGNIDLYGNYTVSDLILTASRFYPSSMLSCRNPDVNPGIYTEVDCLVVYEAQGTVATGGGYNNFFGFDKNGLSDYNNTLYPYVNDLIECIPATKIMPIADLVDSNGDPIQDGKFEFILAEYVLTDAAGGTYNKKEGFAISLIEYTSGSKPKVVKRIEYPISDWRTPAFNWRCDNTTRNYISSPLVWNWDGAGISEIGVGGLNGLQTFKIWVFDSAGNMKDDYPEITSADGTILSNAVKMSAFQDSDDDDICVMGYDYADGQIDLLCGTEDTQDGLWEHVEFHMNTTTAGWDLAPATSNSQHPSSFIHASQQIQEETVWSGFTQNFKEIVTGYGVLKLLNKHIEGADSVSCSTPFINNCHLTSVWVSSYENSIIYPIEFEDIDSKADLIVKQYNALRYIDDGYSKSSCDEYSCLTEYTINPCIDATWQINTSLEVTVQTADIDGDLVSVNVILYEGSTNEHETGWSANVSSTTILTFTELLINKTISNGNLIIQIRDVDTPLDFEEIELSFSVSAQGVEFGGCITTFTAIPLVEDNGISTTGTQIGNNSAETIMADFQAWTGLGTELLLIFVMIVVSIVLLVTTAQNRMLAEHTLIVVGIIAFIDILILFFGTILGWISAAYLITISVLGLIALGLGVYRSISGRGV